MFKVKTAIACFFSVYPINYGSSVVCSSFFNNWNGEKKLFQISNKDTSVKKIKNTFIIFNNKYFKILSVILQIISINNYLKKGNPKKILIIEGASWVGYSFLTFITLKLLIKDIFVIYRGHSVEYEIRKKNNFYLVAIISRYFENYIYKNANISTSVSNIEQKKIKKLYNVKTNIFPNIIKVENFNYKKNRFSNYVFYCGSYEYRPNKIIIDRLVKKIMPAVRKRNRNIELVLTGSEKSKFNESWVHNLKLVSKKNFISLLNKSLCIAIPSKEGYGTRVKIIESLCYGAIILTSPIGIEGIQFKGNISSPIICKTDNDFVKKILYLYKNHLIVKKKIKPFINEYRQKYSASIATKNFYKMVINKI